MKILIKNKVDTTSQIVESKNSVISKQKVVTKTPIKFDRQDRNRVLPFRYRSMFFNTGSLAK